MKYKLVRFIFMSGFLSLLSMDCSADTNRMITAGLRGDGSLEKIVFSSKEAQILHIAVMRSNHVVFQTNIPNNDLGEVKVVRFLPGSSKKEIVMFVNSGCADNLYLLVYEQYRQGQSGEGPLISGYYVRRIAELSPCY